MAKQEFNSKHMVVTRGRVYNKHTGRHLGEVGAFDLEPSTAPTVRTTTDAEKRVDPGTQVEPIPEDEKTVDESALPNPADLTRDEARELASDAGIVGYSTMTKDDLISALQSAGAVASG